MSEKPAFLLVIAFLKLIQVNTQKMGKSPITCQNTENLDIRFFANKSFNGSTINHKM